MAGTVRLRPAACQTSQPRKRAPSVVRKSQFKKKGMNAKMAGCRLIAAAIEGSAEERQLASMVRRVALNKVTRGITKNVVASAC